MSLPPTEPTCWDCGATNDPGSSECWLCHRRDWDKDPGIRWLPSRPEPPRRGPMSTIAGWMILIAAIAVAIGLLRDAPGLAFGLLISVLPALGLTELKARKRRRWGEPMSVVERIFWIVGLTILIPILAVVALVVALFTYCFFFVRFQ